MIKEEKAGDEGNGREDDAEKTKAVRSFVLFSSVKETAEPWYPPLLSLRDDMMDPDQRGEEEGKEENASSPFPRRRRRRSPGLLFSCIFIR